MFTFKSPRAAIMLVFAAFGACVGVWAGSIPQVTVAAGINSYNLGLSLTASSLLGVIAMAMGGVIGRRFSNRFMMLALIPILAIITILLLISTSPLFFFLSLTLFGGLLGALDLFMNAEASAVEHDLGRPVFTAFHGAVSICIAVFAIASSYLSATFGTLAAGAAILPISALAWVLVYFFVPARQLTHGKAGGLSQLPSRLPLVIMGLAAGISISAETSAIFWSAKLLNEQAPALAAITGLGAAFYGLCNGIMRFAGDYLRARFTDIPVMLASIIVATIGFAALGLSSTFAVSTLAFAAVGFGLAVICPCLFNMAAAQAPANRAAGLSFMSMITGAPRVLAPWLFGWIATSQTTSFAFGMCSFILVIAFALVMGLRNMSFQNLARAV